MLDATLDRYKKGEIENIQDVIDELIGISEGIREAKGRGDDLNLSSGEMAFYDALSDNEAAVRQLGDALLCDMAREIAGEVRKFARGDWANSRPRQARLRLAVKKILERYNYPPDRRKAAVNTVLEQARMAAISNTDEDAINEEE